MTTQLTEQNPQTLVIHQRIVDLINTGIWTNISKDRLTRWLRQFQDPDDRYFAALLLSQFVYRPEQQTLALLRQASERVLVSLLQSDVGIEPSQVLEALQDPDGPARIRLIPVRARNDHPGKSADYIARLIRRQLGIASKYMLNPKDAQDAFGRDAKMTFIFFDDFLGTGQQFEDFINTESLKRVINLANCIYLPLIAHQAGIRSLNATFPKLLVAAPEVVPSGSSAFENLTIRTALGNITPSQCRQRYLEILERYKIESAKPLGHGDLSILLAFSHAIPDNTLPIFWHSDDSWLPLFDR